MLTSITNVCRQALESRIHLTFENKDRLLQIYNELKQLLSANEVYRFDMTCEYFLYKAKTMPSEIMWLLSYMHFVKQLL